MFYLIGINSGNFVAFFEIKHLSCQKGFNILFKEINFTAKNSEIVQIKGVNGKGKTSLLKILSGLSLPDSGHISFNNMLSESDEYQKDILYLGHANSISVDLKVIENLEYLRLLNNTDLNLHSIYALKKLGLANFQDEFCLNLSAGQKRRVILSMLVLSKSKVWLFDEPFPALDSLGIELIENLIKQHSDNGGICFFTSHQASSLKVKELVL